MAGEPEDEMEEDASEHRVDALRAFLDHARFGWAAEEERARHLQRERQVATAILLTTAGAFLTAAVSLLPKAGSLGGAIASCFFVVALVAAVVALGELSPVSARWRVKASPDDAPESPEPPEPLPSLSERGPEALAKAADDPDGAASREPTDAAAFASASGRLLLPAHLDVVQHENLHTALVACHLRIYDAFVDLQSRNTAAETRTRAGGAAILVLMFSGVLGIAAALISQPGLVDEPPGATLERRMEAIEAHHEQNNHQDMQRGLPGPEDADGGPEAGRRSAGPDAPGVSGSPEAGGRADPQGNELLRDLRLPGPDRVTEPATAPET